MVLVAAVVADPAGMGQKWHCWRWLVVAYPPAGIGHIMLFSVAMVKGL
jgi:hypothetical protein